MTNINFSYREGASGVAIKSDILAMVKDISIQEKISSWVIHYEVDNLKRNFIIIVSALFRIYNIKLRQFNVLLFYVLHPTLPFVTSLTGIGLFFILSRAS